MESKIQDVIKYIRNFPETKIAKVAREFEILVKAMKAVEAPENHFFFQLSRLCANAVRRRELPTARRPISINTLRPPRGVGKNSNQIKSHRRDNSPAVQSSPCPYR
jgi:hypothetical protein